MRHGTIAERDLELFKYVDTPAVAFDVLKGWLREEMQQLLPAFAKTVKPVER